MAKKAKLDYNEELHKIYNEMFDQIMKTGALNPVMSEDEAAFKRLSISDDVQDKKLSPEIIKNNENIAKRIRDRMSRSDIDKEDELITEIAEKRAKKRLGMPVSEFTPPVSKTAAEELSAAGSQGEIIANKMRDAGIDIDNLSMDDATRKLKLARESNVRREIPKMSTIGDESISEARFKEIKNQLDKDKLLKGVGKKAVLGAGLGASAASIMDDLSDDDAVGALLDVAETGAAYVPGIVGRAAPGLELLRATPTQTQEQEDKEIEENKFNRLKKYLAKKGLTSEI